MNKPIPKNLLQEFKACIDVMSNIADDDGASDARWFAMLEDAAEKFLRDHKLRGDRNDAAHQYIAMIGTVKE